MGEDLDLVTRFDQKKSIPLFLIEYIPMVICRERGRKKTRESEREKRNQAKEKQQQCLGGKGEVIQFHRNGRKEKMPIEDEAEMLLARMENGWTTDDER